jgi:hypothetical protein
VRAAALLLLASCAPVVAPSSLPFVTIDDSIPGAKVSRQAAEVWVIKRKQDAATCDARVTDCETRAKIAEYDAEEQRRVAGKAVFWQRWGPPLVVTSTLTGAAVGAFLLWLIMQAVAH